MAKELDKQCRLVTGKALFLLTHHENVKYHYKKAKKSAVKLRQRAEDCNEALHILQSLAKSIQEKTHSKLASIVSECLKAVFPNPYEMKIDFLRKRNRTEAQISLVRKGLTLTNPLDEASGGQLDVAAMALRLACLVMAKPSRSRILVLDEPFKNISPRFYHLIPPLLLKLSEQTKTQIVLTTNILAFACGRVNDIQEKR